MFADTVIAEALNDLRRHSAVPKFRNLSTGEVRLEMKCCSTREATIKEISAAPGVYPVVWSAKLDRRGHRQDPDVSDDPLLDRAQPGNVNNQNKAGRMLHLRSQHCQDFIRDEEASISLWTVPLDHACVPESERRGEMQDSDEDGEPQPASRRTHGPEDVWASNAIRVALDFTMSNGRPMRRTGTVLLQGQKPTGQSDSRGPEDEDLSSMGWSVRWDHCRWFAGTQASLIVPTPPSPSSGSGSGSPSSPIEVQDNESRFVLLVWKEKVPSSNVQRSASRGADGSTQVTMIFKKHDCTGGRPEPVEFTEEEKRAFRIGLSEEDGFGAITMT